MLLRAILSIPDIGQIDAFAEPWRRLYGTSTLLSTAVLFGHIGGLFAAGGLAVAADRATLRVDPTDVSDRRRHLADRERLYRPIWIALGVAMLCGVMLFFADVEAFAGSAIFWTKMVLVALMLANVVLTARLDASLRRDDTAPEVHSPPPNARRWRRRRAGAIASAILWFLLLLAGTALASH
jgi:hypothetical protein